VTRGGHAKVGHLSGDGDRGKLALEHLAHDRVDLGDGEIVLSAKVAATVAVRRY
jgi:hypothetical protein